MIHKVYSTTEAQRILEEIIPNRPESLRLLFKLPQCQKFDIFWQDG